VGREIHIFLLKLPSQHIQYLQLLACWTREKTRQVPIEAKEPGLPAVEGESSTRPTFTTWRGKGHLLGPPSSQQALIQVLAAYTTAMTTWV
jgi:hypothetical protein